MIVITATFVSEPIENPLAWLLEEAGLRDQIAFAPYNQVFQQLLTPSSEISLNSSGVGVAIVRFEDFIRDLPELTFAKETIDRLAKELLDALEKFSGRAKTPLIVAMLPPGPAVNLGLVQTLTAATHFVSRQARALPGIHVLDNAQIDTTATPIHDRTRDELAHIPFTEEYYAALALAITRKVHALKVPTAKVLVLDCDNTIWRGVVGEDGLTGLEISAPYLAVQDFAIAQQAKGILICLASKNTEADVLEVLEKRADMRLSADHIVAHRINWQVKSANIRSLATELNLGLDSFVFIDDNPVECAQMRAELPQVTTLQLPPESDIQAFLSRLWSFDKLTSTAEDAGRTRMYKENSARRVMESAASDIGEFIASLDIKIDIAPPSKDEWPRLEQLTQRTNQFNFTTRRRTEKELISSLARGEIVLRVRVSDRFGDYGLVGVIVASVAGPTLLVDNLMLSCRVLGRGVEHSMVKRLGDIAESLKLSDVSLPYVKTARNVPALAFADSIASEFAEQVSDGAIYRIPTSHASATRHRPGHDPEEIIAARAAEEKKGAATNGSEVADRSDRYSRFANVLISGRAVCDQIMARPRRGRQMVGEAVPPSSQVESALLEIWEEILNQTGLGVDDDFFALGGTSLLSVELFAKIARKFDAQLRLTAILEAPTVRGLAKLIDRSSLSDQSGIVTLRPGGPFNLFLVHDGLGETLLYLNLARRIPPTVAVYGIEPKRLPGIPLAHTSIESMAAFYVSQIQAIQSHGPYLLGGMCAGGVIAYQMAANLVAIGEQVDLVTIMDGATPQAAKQAGLGARRRLSRLENALAEARSSGSSLLDRFASLTMALCRKAANFLSYQLYALWERCLVRTKFALFNRAVHHGAAWPSAFRQLSVMQIYNAVESKYSPPILTNVPVLLVRASTGEGNDTPYRDLYCDKDFGWGRVAKQLEIVDVAAGHSSMLQEEAVVSLAGVIVQRLAGQSAIERDSLSSAPRRAGSLGPELM